MAQKVHRARRDMADKDTLEVCFAIDSDEDREVIAEADNSEGTTFEDEVPPQVCKNTAKRSRMKAVWGMKRNTALTLFLKHRKRKEGENNLRFLARGREEFAALSPLEKQKLAKEAAATALPETLEEKKEYIKKLMHQLTKVEKVLAHIGATYYFEIDFGGSIYTISQDGRPREVPKRPLQAPSSNSNYLRKCVQKVFNEAYATALGKEKWEVTFPYKKHFLAPIVKVTGIPEGVKFKNPSYYGVPKLKEIIANKANIKMELLAPSVAEEPAFCTTEAVQTTVVQDSVTEDPAFCTAQVVQTTVMQDSVGEDRAFCASEAVQAMVVQDSVAEDPAFCAAEAVQTAVVQDILAEDPAFSAAEAVKTAVVQDIFMPGDPVSEVVQTIVVLDMQEVLTSNVQLSPVKKNFAKQHQEPGGKKQRTGPRTPWTAAEVHVVQQHFSEVLAGLKPVARSNIDSFLAKQTVVKRTSAAVEKYLLRNRKKNRPDDQ